MSETGRTWRTELRRRPLAGIAMALIRFYQMWISPAFPPSCRFYPSCSAYAMTAVQRFGPLKGIRLAAWRLLRCNPWNPGGVDHVPAVVGSRSPQTL
ncbi:membrane protein insertion efficiency factor YidD [Arsenicicoccus piscis]|uniref:Putative membrane protein insertion efficiency factor n=1 Tax=Arsenicicoccus piscis TaxID=673954 RepID=A0ABQ6HSX4_9MICO|nr:membrane protein insertion efficiency factor YidD [Arsenicicoccus piscis]MCH8627418.1 membrane protein insertion efficiency factor YidD [Arsenicicoccus piscis]GMA21580.1 hypothetical protein GCM10025862_36010 [Arsenicicoccus piscis]